MKLAAGRDANRDSIKEFLPCLSLFQGISEVAECPKIWGAGARGALCVQMDFTPTFQANVKCNHGLRTPNEASFHLNFWAWADKLDR